MIKLFQRVGLFSLCLTLLAGMAAPAGAEGAADGLRRCYYDPNRDTAPLEAWLWPGDSPDGLSVRRKLYQRGNDEEWQFFGVDWKREDFDAALDRGEATFKVEGAFNADYLDSEARALWDSGQLEIVAGSEPLLTVHIRPDGMESHLALWEEPEPLSVTPTTAFGDARFPAALATCADEDYDSAPYDHVSPSFRVEWDEADYLAGLESKAPSFTVGGTYAGPLEPADPGDGDAQLLYERYLSLWNAGKLSFREPAPEITVTLMEQPEAPLVYTDNRQADYHAVVSAGTAFTELGGAVPSREELYLDDGWGDGMTFKLTWDEAEYQAGIEGGVELFRVTGAYTLEDETMRRWMEEGLIRVASPPPSLAVHVVREGAQLLREDTVKLRSYGGGIIPAFLLPSMVLATRVVCAYSTDNETWHSAVLDPIYYRSHDDADWYNVAVFDDHEAVYGVDPEAPVYCKVTVTGSAWAGEWRYTLNEAADRPPTVNDGDDDDQGGDHGGGGQGEHDRPGKPGKRDGQEELGQSSGLGSLKVLWESLTAVFAGMSPPEDPPVYTTPMTAATASPEPIAAAPELPPAVPEAEQADEPLPAAPDEAHTDETPQPPIPSERPGQTPKAHSGHGAPAQDEAPALAVLPEAAPPPVPTPSAAPPAVDGAAPAGARVPTAAHPRLRGGCGCHRGPGPGRRGLAAPAGKIEQ